MQFPTILEIQRKISSMSIFICQFCGSERFSKKSLTGHETFCQNNQNRKIPTNNSGRKQQREAILLEVQHPAIVCSYGCGLVAKYKNKSGRLMCNTSSNKCPENKRKNSENTKFAYSSGQRVDQKTQYKNLPKESKSKMAWATGLTKDTDSRIEKIASKIRGKRKTTDKEKILYLEYREKCAFNFSNYNVSNVKGYNLLEELGMYHKRTNKNGVVRDHRISICYGWVNNIDPKIISHPANCEFITHKKNASKSFACSIELEQLLEEIKKWDCEGNRHTLLVENQ